MRVAHKFHAKRVEDRGQNFPSTIEWKYFLRLEMLQKAGELLFFLRQVPFHLPGGVKYVIDFVEFWRDGEIRFTEVKGMETAEFKAKKKMVEALYPIEIQVVKKRF